LDRGADAAARPGVMLVPPEALRLTPGPAAVPATITSRRFVGPSAVFTARTDGGAVLEVIAPPQAVPAGARVGSCRAGGSEAASTCFIGTASRPAPASPPGGPAAGPAVWLVVYPLVLVLLEGLRDPSG
jgi:hypothetical protein